MCKKLIDDCFYSNPRWGSMKFAVYDIYDKKCMKCKITNAVFHVDHIKPKSKYPHLALDIRNLQVLCADCNLSKSNYNSIDYRTSEDINNLIDLLSDKKYSHLEKIGKRWAESIHKKERIRDSKKKKKGRKRRRRKTKGAISKTKPLNFTPICDKPFELKSKLIKK